jgi:hypothetical protein
MADDQLAGIGWGGEFWLGDEAVPSVLTELTQVKSFTLPQDEAERVEISHLKSPGRRREYAPGMIEPGEFEVVLNYRAGSDTDQLIATALTDGISRPFKAVIPERGQPVRDWTGFATVSGYDRGEVNVDDAMEATVTLTIDGATAEIDHVVSGSEILTLDAEAAKQAEKDAKAAASKKAA